MRRGAITTARVSIAEEIDRMIEERTKENHTGLWLRFGAALRLTRRQIIETDLLPEMLQLVDTYRETARRRLDALCSFLAGANESDRVPEGAE